MAPADGILRSSASFTDVDEFLLEKDDLNRMNTYRKHGTRRHELIAYGNVVVLIVNLLFFASAYYQVRFPQVESDVRLSSDEFTRDAIQLELHSFDDIFNYHQGVFRGDPRPELDDAWMGLIHGALKPGCIMENVLTRASGYNTRVPAWVPLKEATPNHTLVELNDGSGDHYAVLAVLHELHCLVRFDPIFEDITYRPD